MSNSLNGNLETLFGKMENFITTKTVVGEPIHIGDVILVPLVDVAFGVGAGANVGNEEKSGKESGAGGLGARVTPSAVIVIMNGSVQMVNVKNNSSVNKLIDMVPGILSKFNLDFLFSKNNKSSSQDVNLEFEGDAAVTVPIAKPVTETE